MNQKMTGMVLLAVGIGLTGASGAALSTDYRAYLALEGQLAFAEALAEEAHVAYCEARAEPVFEPMEDGRQIRTEWPPADGCPGDDAAEDVDSEEASEAAAADESEEMAPEAELWETRVLEVADLAHTTDELPAEVAVLRQAWVERLAETVPHLHALASTPVVAPRSRVEQWFQDNGLIFLLGFVCVVAGAVMSRRAFKSELTEDSGSGPAEGAVDFGDLLGRVVDEARGIQVHMAGLAAPTLADLDAIQVHLERLQKEDLERLVGAGPRLQMKYGVGPFAQVFSPLAGGERRLNRLWSTLVDRHWPEAVASIDAAVAQLEAAQAAFEAAKKAA